MNNPLVLLVILVAFMMFAIGMILGYRFRDIQDQIDFIVLQLKERQTERERAGQPPAPKSTLIDEDDLVEKTRREMIEQHKNLNP